MTKALSRLFKAAARTIILVALFSLTGCVQSVYPWYEERDVGFDQDLAGVWVGEGDIDSCVLEIIGDPARDVRHYNFEISKLGDGCPDIKDEFKPSGGGQLVRIAGQRFLDAWDDDYHLHNLVKVNLDPKTLSLVAINSDTLGDLIRHKCVKLRGRVEGHTMWPNDVLLTSPTRDLRKFLIDHAGDPKLFSTELRFHRKAK